MSSLSSVKLLCNSLAILLFFALAPFNTFSQTPDKWCQYHFDESVADAIALQLKHATEQYKTFSSEDTVYAAVKIHLIARTNGSGRISDQHIIEVMKEVNEYFAPSLIQFFIFGDINHINSDAFYDFRHADEAAIGQLHDVSNAINMYFANTVSIGSSGVCGYAYFPGGPNRILIANGCADYGVITHELGHYFTLHHTHGRSNSALTDELVNGSNCATAGDEVCDTPADPNLYGQVNSNCEYTGGQTDANGDPFDPDTGNIMSYSFCFDRLSEQQYSRMNAAYYAYRSFLARKNFVVNFEADATQLCSGETVQLTNRSHGATRWEWTFEGGQPATSTEQHPAVTYTAAGRFSIRLKIFDEEDQLELHRTDFITVTESPQTPEITYDPLINQLQIPDGDHFDVRWYVDGQFIFNNSATRFTYRGPASYQVEVFSSAVCSATSEAFVILSAQPHLNSLIQLYPNPVKDVLTIINHSSNQFAGSAYYVIHGLDGRELQRAHWVPLAAEYQIDFAGIPAGIYMVTIYLGDQQLTKKVLKH
jgi:PKD repeat protein